MEEFLNDFAWGFCVYIESFYADPTHKGEAMKKPYDEILNTTTGGYRIEVKQNLSKFVVKVAKAEMKNFDKKAPPEYFKDQQGVKDHLRQKCSLFSIDFDRIENQLNKAIKPLSEGDIPTTDEPIVANGGILLKVQKWLGLKTEQVCDMP